jgi:predicted membrane channel-forming protein YqfA (hemolysin III family)
MAARVLITILVGGAISAAIYFLTLWGGHMAIADRAATCTQAGCFCERPLSTLPEQLVDSFSSLAFVFLGVWSLIPTRIPIVGTPERRLKPLFGIIFVFIGASSFFYHSTLSFFGQFLDIFSMYTFGILLAIGALYRAGKMPGWLAIAVFTILNVLFAVIQYDFPDARRVLFVGLLIPGIILELTPFVTGFSPRAPQVRFIYVGVATMLVAYLFWVLDQTKGFCSPTSWFQGHALWHVLTAVAAFMIVLHYRRTPHGSS